MKFIIPILLAMCCCQGAETTVTDPAPTSTTTTVQSPFNTVSYRVMGTRTNSEGEQNIITLAGGVGKLIDEGTEFVIQRGDAFIVCVRAMKKQDGLVECQVIPESWNAQERRIELGDVALVRQIEKKTEKKTEDLYAPVRKYEGPFDQVLCLDGSRRSPCEWVVNPYFADSEKNHQQEIRKRLAQSVTLNLKQVLLRDSLKTLSRITNVNIVVKLDPSVDMTVILDLQDVPCYDYIGYLCEITGLLFRVDDHAIVIFQPSAE